MLLLPTLRQLQFFVALARRESFSRAAEDCLVSQSTLSSAIKELEALMEAQLVDRSTRSFSLTPAGEIVAEQGAAILAHMEDMTLAVRDRPLLSGAFQLGVIPTIAPFLLPSLSKHLKQSYPALDLYLREDLSASLVAQLASGFLDAALLALPYDMPGMDFINVGEDAFWFACAPDHPLAEEASISIDQLAGNPLLLLEDGHCLRDHALDACQLRSAQQNVGYAGTSLLTLAEMTRAGLGATLLPDMAVRQWSGMTARGPGFGKGQGENNQAGLIVRPLEPPNPSRSIGIAWRKGSGRAEEAKALAGAVTTALHSLQNCEI